MPHIQVLDQITIDKIAAGEVIERPASIVKELVENAIDAEATSVVAEIQEGGISFIRITDNGTGIPREDVPYAFLRHSTSKIRSVEDLSTIASLGFRGEALSSIAAVTKTELITKTKEDVFGTKYTIEGGKELSIEDTGAPDGTTFLVRQLFYNVPARRKFLKTPTTEAGHIQDLLMRLALSHPEVSLKLISNNQEKLRTSGNGQLKDVIYNIYGREVAANLLDIDYEQGGLHITGYIGKPVITRSNRNFENFFVNGRYVKSAMLSKAVEDGYRDFLMQHKFPFVVLHFHLTGDDIDVNVHPTKMELRFQKQQEVYNTVFEAVHRTLLEPELIQVVDAPEPVKEKDEKADSPFLLKPKANMPAGTGKIPPRPVPEEKPVMDEDYFMEKMRERVIRAYRQESEEKAARERQMNQQANDPAPSATNAAYQTPPVSQTVRPADPVKEAVPMPQEDVSRQDMVKEAAAYKVPEPAEEAATAASVSKPYETVSKSVEPSMPASKPEEEIPAKKPEQMDLFEENFLKRDVKAEYKLVGQVFDTYWIVEFHDNMYIIDQHAAHERVLYERTMRGMKTREFTSQYLSPPIILSLSMQEAEILNTHMDRFAAIGFEIEPFGGEEFAVRAVPDNLFSIAKKDLLLEMIDNLSDGINTGMTPDLIDEKVASMSCKAAVKGNNKLSAMEANALIGELLELENPYHCPHGRPTIIAMTKRELEKKFKRIV